MTLPLSPSGDTRPEPRTADTVHPSGTDGPAPNRMMERAVTETKEARMTEVSRIVQSQPSTVVTPLGMIDRAIAQGATIETLERLMALQERWEASEARKEFDEAISAAKAEIKPIIKNRKVDFTTAKGRTNYDYEDLASISEAVDPILARYGLSYRFRASQEQTRVTVTCIMSHRRGHREETALSSFEDQSGNKNQTQGIGSAATYLQRYTLKLALGLAATKDTDGRIADDEPKPIDEAQFRYLNDLLEKSESDEGKFLAYIGAQSLETMTQAQYRKAETVLRSKIAKKGAA